MADFPPQWRFPQPVTLLSGFAWTILLAALCGIAATSAIGLRVFSLDSWSYWELAQTVFNGDFFRIEVRRQFQIDTPYSISFPPLWPVMVALAAEATLYEPFIMPILAGLVALATFVVLEVAFRVQSNLPGIGLVTGLGMLSFGSYVDEIAAGRSIPLALFWLAVLSALAIGPLTRRRAFAMGVVAGLAVMTRFDALPFAAAFLLLMGAGFVRRPQVTWPTRLGLTALFGAGLLLAVSPYIAYSLTHFGLPWISDNSRVALSAESIFVTDYYTVWPATAIEAPLQWLHKVLVNAMGILPNLIVVSGGIFAVAAGVFWLAGRRLGPMALASLPLRPIIVIAIAWVMAFSAQFFVGYGNIRYQSPTFMTGLMLLAMGLSSGLRGTSAGRVAYAVIQLVAAILVTVRLTGTSPIDPISLAVRPSTGSEIPRHTPPVELCLKPYGAESVLILEDSTLAARMGAVAEGHEILMMPRNLEDVTDETLRDFLSKYRVGSVLAGDTGPHVVQMLPRVKRMMPDLAQCEQLPALWIREVDISDGE